MERSGNDRFGASSRVAIVQASANEQQTAGAHRPPAQMADLELFQEALIQRSDDACSLLVEHFQGRVLAWVHHHPQRELACQYHDPPYYVALAFERFWHATTRNPLLGFHTLEAALSYLKASLNGAILDTLRACARSEVPLPEPGLSSSPLASEEACGEQDLWEVLTQLLPTPRERRVAYLLFHCGLKPREIVRWCADEFPEVGEIYRLRRQVVERLLCLAETIR